jgi:hypothetical protein
MTEKELRSLVAKSQDLSQERWNNLRRKAAHLVRKLWQEVEREFAPTLKKY